jgi:hypothetical protein
VGVAFFMRCAAGAWSLPDELPLEPLPSGVEALVGAQVAWLGRLARTLAEAHVLSPVAALQRDDYRLLVSHADERSVDDAFDPAASPRGRAFRRRILRARAARLCERAHRTCRTACICAAPRSARTAGRAKAPASEGDRVPLAPGRSRGASARSGTWSTAGERRAAIQVQAEPRAPTIRWSSACGASARRFADLGASSSS